MRNGFAQRQRAGQRLAFGARLAGLFELRERDFSGLIREIESDPLFARLRNAPDPRDRVIRARRLAQTDLSRRFFELKEEAAAAPGGGGDVENLLSGKEKLVETARRVGEEEFKRYFIFNEEGLTPDEIAARTGLTAGEAAEIAGLVDTVDVYGEFFEPGQAQSAAANTKVAAIEPEGDGFVVKFFSPHWARGLYEVDRDRIERLFAEGKLERGDRKALGRLLDKIDLINIKKSLMHRLLSGIARRQSAYLNAGGQGAPAPLRQSELAASLGVHPSIISRAVNGRSVETPWGGEKPLREFFRSPAEARRESAMRHIREIISKEEKPLSDREISALLLERYGETVAQRTVAKYRRSMDLPDSYRR